MPSLMQQSSRKFIFDSLKDLRIQSIQTTFAGSSRASIVNGLKQAPYEWNQLLNQHLHAYGFQSLKIDPCIYGERQKPMIIAVYVDNTIYIDDGGNIESLKKVLSKKFATKDLGKAHYILVIDIMHDLRTQRLYLHQHHKINDILEGFKLE